MKLKHDKVLAHHKRPVRELATAASAFALVVSGIGATKVDANTNHMEKKPDHAAPAPRAVLTGIIADLEAGKSVEVTKQPLQLAGVPSGMVVGHPIEFTDGEQSYLAYTSGSKPNFDTTPEETAATMAVVTVQLPSDYGTKLPVTKAHLDGNNVLVENKNHNPVGYGIDGNG